MKKRRIQSAHNNTREKHDNDEIGMVAFIRAGRRRCHDS